LAGQAAAVALSACISNHPTPVGYEVKQGCVWALLLLPAFLAVENQSTWKLGKRKERAELSTKKFWVFLTKSLG
jgi:hypothetical protein